MFEEVKEKFNKVISFSQGVENPITDDLFENWYKAKKPYIDLMGGKLIWEWPEKVSFELSEKGKIERCVEFCDTVSLTYYNDDLADFIYAQKETFFNNIVSKEYKTPNGIEIPKGMKLVKAFKFFEENTTVLNELQSIASMIIQENKVEGYLCLSVHPLDFLSSSENTHNWRSCHSLDGDYRGGNLSYMVDDCTVMCYLKSAKDEILPNFPKDVKWNSKKWRVLLFFSNDFEMLFAGRQYPFVSESGLNFVRSRVLPAANFDFWTEWTNKRLTEFDGHNLITPYVFAGNYNGMMRMDELVYNGENSLQFNDLLDSTCYIPMYCFNNTNNLFKISKPKFVLGKKCNCLRCNNDIIKLSETVMCNDCEAKYGEAKDSDTFATCNLCGGRYVYEDSVWVNDGEENICPSCAAKFTSICEECGDTVYTRDIVFNRKNEMYVCVWCNDWLKGVINDGC